MRASNIPNREQRELRELVRYRRTVLQQRAQLANRIEKVLQGNIKLGVASDGPSSGSARPVVAGGSPTFL